jgi:hypothetical protein
LKATPIDGETPATFDEDSEPEESPLEAVVVLPFSNLADGGQEEGI